jgi:ABC-type multidrug transport system ATPase subunit
MAQRGYLDPRACGESARAILQETNMVALGENQVHTLTVNQKLRLGIALKSLPGTQVLVVNDDFTRGLEADAVLEIMLTLRRRARSGIAVLVRLMQPTTDLFALFDKALFLSCGRVAYFGPADETNVYFTRPELDYAYHEGENPADFAFDICSGQIFPKGWTHKRSGENLYSLYIESEYAFRFPESRAQAQAAEQQSAMQSGMSGEPWPLRDSFRYLALEFGKRWRLALRDPRSRLMLLATPIAAGLLLGIACLRAAMTSVDDSLVMWGPDGSYHFLAPGATVSSNIFYFCIVASSLANILHIEDVQRRQSIFLQDLAGRKSSPLAAHCLVCVLAPLPYLLARCLLVLALLYPMAGLPSSGGAFFTTLVFSFLSAASSHYYLLLLAACNLDKSSPSEAKAQNLLAAFVTPLTLIASLGGCFNSARDVAVYYRWFYEPVMVQAWSTYNEPALPSTNGSVPLPSSTASSDFVLSTYGMQENSVVMNVSLLFMAMLILVLLLYAIMLASPPGAKKLESAEYASEVRGGREGHTSKSGRADAKPSRLGAPKINRRVGYSKLLDDSTVRSDAEVVSSGDPGQTRSHRSSLASSSSDGDVEANEPRSRRSSSYTAPEGEIRTVEYFRENSRDVNPIKGVRLVFRHLSFSVSSSSNENDQKYLLRNVSGRANPGEVCGILGPTNSGKNPLMRLLAGLALSEGGEIAGDILFDGVERTPSVTRSTAFVAGSTQLIPMLTVREFVSYAAQLKVPKASTQKLIDRRVQKVLRVAGLAEQADTIIGEVARAGGRRRARLLGCWADALTPRQSPSLTGRERMRLSLAMEVVAFPDLLFVDMEAAAGVDRIAQLEMMSCIRNISSATRATTLLTLDRPSRAVFGMLDKLVLLAEGRVLYFGPARDSPKFFTTSPFQFPCAPGISPSDFLCKYVTK